MNELEKALVALTPASPRLDRDALMYSAGHGSIPRRLLWPTAACGFALIAIGLGIRATTSQPRIVERVVYMRDEALSKPVESQPAGASESLGQLEDFSEPYRSPYLELERQILKRGDVPMPEAPANALGASSMPSLDKELDLLPGRTLGLKSSSPF
jgi:hypothetical protein